MFDPTTATWYLRSETSAGAPDAGQFQYGGVGWKPITGDWDGNGTTTVGVFAPNATFYLRNENAAGPPDAGQFGFGLGGWAPVSGVWQPLHTPTSHQAAVSASLAEDPFQLAEGINDTDLLDAIFSSGRVV
jgi:hypothetical protein